MCILLTDNEASSTKLFNIPVILDKKPHVLLLYTNSLEVEDEKEQEEENQESFFITTYCNEEDEREAQKAKLTKELKEKTKLTTPALMIVAIPNINNNSNFGLVDVNTKDMSQLRSDIIDLCTRDKGKNACFDADDSEEDLQAKLQVNKVGNYNISVAPNLDSLCKQIDWDIFTLPSNFNSRLDTLKDKNLFKFNYAYVVAQAVTNIRDDGFGVIYEDPGFTYFPTCHENQEDNLYNYDVICYNICTNKLKLKLNLNLKETIENYSMNDTVFNMFNMLTCKCVMSKNNRLHKYDIRDNISTIQKIIIKNSNMQNMNIIYEKH
jgi:hypothetical protein